ncbi:uncharacterized protein PAE49_022665 isoform 3-T3 [Odontesthes bonariensis]
MSRPRSGSPSYRRFPWEEPDFDPHKVLAELDGTPWDRRHRFREGPEELVDSFREEMYPEEQRRSSPFPDNHQYGRQHHPEKEEFYHRRLSPRHDGMRFEHQRLTPLDDGWFDTERRRGGFREHFQKFENKETLSKSPLRVKREELLPTSRSHSDHQQREPGTSWWREEQGRGQGRFRDFSPRSADQRAGDRERGRWTTQGPNRGRQRENPHHERAPPFKRPRREMDDADHLGSLCYSTDRQLSFDLVNVGRQRLDFLPMLEHSGTYQETAMHTGTFAQEIITLVHLVKEQYFRGDGVTLNQRFSAPQKAGVSEEEPEELTLNQRFSSNRGFSLNLESLLDEEPLFSRLGPMQGLIKQPLRGPGDLRHDLERRRQEKLEGVRVTIAGSSISQRPLGQVRESDRMSPVDHEGFSNWSGMQNRRQKGDIGPRIGASNRLNTAPQRRNNRFANRRHNMHNDPEEPNW